MNRTRLVQATLALTLLCGGASTHAIVGGIPTSAFGQVDSGVQITDNWVLTARHVGYAVNGTYTNGYGSSTIAARYDFDGSAFPENDLALLRLAASIDSPDLVLAATALPFGVLASPVAVTIVSGSNQDPRGRASAYVQEVATAIDPDGSGPSGQVPVNYLIAYNLPDYSTPPYVEGGDSGGALFMGHVTDSDSALLGITSASLTGTVGGSPFHGSAFVQIASYRSWIDQTMQYDQADSQLALWVSSVPEPMSATLWPLGLAALGWASRRRQRQRG